MPSCPKPEPRESRPRAFGSSLPVRTETLRAGTPLSRSVSLPPVPTQRQPEQGNAALRPSGGLPRVKHLRNRSPKAARQQRERVAVLKELFPEPVVCAVPECSQEATDPHEPLTRARGGSITDPNNIVGLCRKHHDEVHLEPAWAYELGLLRHSWDGGAA